MKFVNLQLSVLMLLAIFGCKSESEVILSEPLVGNFIKSPDMGVFIFIDSVAFGRRTGWAGTVAVMNDTKVEEVFHTGNGHNEFQRVSYSKGNDNSLLLLNNPISGDKLLSLTVVPKANNIAAIKDVSSWKKYDLSRLPAFFTPGQHFVSLSDSTILVLGAPYEDRHHIFSVIDFKNQNVTPLDYWPEEGVEGKEGDNAKWNYFTSSAYLFGNGKGRYFYKHDMAPYSFIFSIDGKKVNIIKQLYSEVSEYESRGGNYKITKYARSMRACANSRNIYILLMDYDSEGNPLDPDDLEPVYGKIVEVYDWNGNKQREIHLDRVVKEILVSNDNNTLYGQNYYVDRELDTWTYDLRKDK